jgi:hypothetical protein
LGGALGRQHPVAADDRTGVVVADHEVIAELVELVHVEAGTRGMQPRAHLLGENLMTQSLRRDHFFVRVGDEKGVSGGVRGELGTRLISADEEL